jgi:hypothetical protein
MEAGAQCSPGTWVASGGRCNASVAAAVTCSGGWVGGFAVPEAVERSGASSSVGVGPLGQL